MASALAARSGKWWVLVTMTGSASIVLLDETVVAVALPSIQRDLHMTQTQLQWVVNAFLLGFAAFVAVGGRLGDMFGQARMFRLGVALFVAASVASGFAVNDWMLLASRGVQGLGAAIMIPPSAAIIVNTFSAEERGKAMGVYAGISLIFLALGPLVGGLLTEGITWRAVFLVNLPVGVAILLLANRTLTHDRPDEKAALHPVSLVTLVGGLTALVFGLMQSQVWGWGSPATILLLSTGAVLLSGFAVYELRAKAPLIQLRLFASRNFTGDTLVLFCMQFALIGMTVFGSIWVQNVLGFSPITAGASLLPAMVPLLFVAPLAGRLYDRVGVRSLSTIGATLVAAGLFFIGLLLHKQSYAWIVPGYVVVGIGIGLVVAPDNTDAMNAAPSRLRGQASGLVQTMRQTGSTVGLAILGTIVTMVFADHVGDFLAGSGLSAAQQQHAQQLVAQSKGGLPSHATLPHQVEQALRDSLTTGVSTMCLVAGSVMAAAGLVALLILRRRSAVDAPPAVPTSGRPADLRT